MRRKGPYPVNERSNKRIRHTLIPVIAEIITFWASLIYIRCQSVFIDDGATTTVCQPLCTDTTKCVLNLYVSLKPKVYK